MRQRSYIWAVGFAIILLLAFVFQGLLFTQNLPDDELLIQDLSKFLELDVQKSSSLQVNQVTVSDGWSDGLELKVQFSLIPQNDILLDGGPLRAVRLIKSKTYSSGSAELSYKRSVDGTWRVISKRLIVIPTEKMLSE